MKISILIALVATVQSITVLKEGKWEINHTVKPEGEAHVEPPGQGRVYSPPSAPDTAWKALKANGIV